MFYYDDGLDHHRLREKDIDEYSERSLSVLLMTLDDDAPFKSSRSHVNSLILSKSRKLIIIFVAETRTEIGSL